MRLPSLLLCIAGAFLALPSYATSVYELAQSYEPEQQERCMYTPTISVLSQLNTVTTEKIAELNAYNTGTVKYQNAAAYGDPSVNTSCVGAQAIRYEFWQINSSGTWYKSSTQIIGVGVTGSKMTTITCPSAENIYSTVSYKDNAGTITDCYVAAELADVDTCPNNYTDNYSIIPNQDGLTDSTVCLTLDDGSESRCGYDLSDDGSYYSVNFENTGCYETTDEISTEPTIDTSTQCEELSAGVAMCLESESEMCTNGVCQSGCGTVGLSDGTSYFVCIDSDTDSDSIPDYSDTDIDGDGILNEDDDDVDGDGITNNADSDYDGSSVTTSYTTVVVDNSGIEEKLSELIEQADFDSVVSDNATALNAQSEAVDTAADELLEAIDFTDVEDGTGFYDSLDSLATYFASTCQTFSWVYRSEAIQLDTCEIKEHIEPYLYILFAVGTALYIFFRVGGVISGSKQ